ncbi:hypothetical protein [Enterobacter sp. NFIX58]|uniref:hypothetical protein n=1 Tax=Enterobacter sp. NFIX58 TaxID=1566251 RepID=UPI0008D38803|nr:hypothetical protein [Enterobacter sp. NFIX58]SEP40265.1 hypothetical protein SAMN03159286_0162 [Enterobacter sp. NFIX58]
MSNRIDGEIIRGVINDPRLFSGIQRSRAGTYQRFGERIVKGGKLIQECDFELTPPVKSWYSKEIDGVWHWVEGCDHCNGSPQDWAYCRCEKHDVCVDCGIDREHASTSQTIAGMGAVWGCRGGWRCNDCQEKINQERLAAAEARIIPDDEYDELDFWHEDKARCPWCKAEISTDESYDACEEEHTCYECERKFKLTAEHSVSRTTIRSIK